MKPRHSTRLPLGILSLCLSSGLHGQTTWDGGANPNSSGNWNTDPTFWSTDLAPTAAQNVLLNDVTTGTRVVSLTTAGSANTLALTQSTAGAVNQLDLNAILTLGSNGDQTVLATTNTSGSLGGTVINLNTGGGLLVNSTGIKTFQNAGTLNFNGGVIDINIGANSASNRILTNTGIVNVTVSSAFTFFHSQLTNSMRSFVFTNSAGAQLNVSSGTFDFGNRQTSGAHRANSVTVNNSGSTTVAPAAILLIQNLGGNQAGDTSASTFATLSGGIFDLGSPSNQTGKGTLLFDTTSGGASAPITYSLNNTGTSNIYGQSAVNANRAALVTAFGITNNTGGILNLAADGTGNGITLGSDSTANTLDTRHNITFTNAGTVNTSVIGGAATGIVTLGQTSTNATARNSVTLNNNPGGILNVGADTTLLMRNKVASGGALTNAINNASGATINLGSNVSTSTGGTIQQSVSAVTTFNALAAPVFNNSGTINAYGTSVVELSTGSTSDAALNTYAVANNSGGALNLYDTARIGNGTKVTAFTNAGTLTKNNSGTAQILSAAGGSNNNSGDINVNAGSLSFGLALGSSAGAITVANGADLAVGGTGTALTGGSLNLNGTLTTAGSLSLTGASVQLGAADRINNSANISLNGGTLLTGGFSEGVSVLTLSGGASTVNLGGGSSVLSFADSSSAAWTGTLSILNWSGMVAGNGTDQVYFGSSAAGLSVPQVGAISFVNPDGFAAGSYGATLLPTGELVPVPEPRALLSALLAASTALLRRRRPGQSAHS